MDQHADLDGFRVTVRTEPGRSHAKISVHRIGDGGGCVAIGRLSRDGKLDIDASAWMPDTLIHRGLVALGLREAPTAAPDAIDAEEPAKKPRQAARIPLPVTARLRDDEG